ncbi:MAG TPA: diguanylate cyclase [Pirellulaceae bacterium]|nr:diguanylate cyclase [Pirellulaceae bacterium]
MGFLVTLVMWAASGIGLLPNQHLELCRNRIAATDSLAISSVPFVETKQVDRLNQYFVQWVKRRPEIRSIGLRDASGELIAATAEHSSVWLNGLDDAPTVDQMHVDLINRGVKHGRLEVAFAEASSGFTWWGWVQYPLNLFMFCSALLTLLAWLYLGRVLKYLNPANAVPKRVRSAFDSLAEGLLLLDPKHRILLTNQAFAEFLGLEPDTLIGQVPTTWPWQRETNDAALPWEIASTEITTCKQLLSLPAKHGAERRLSACATPILGDNREVRGIMVSFDDVTLQEQKKEEMLVMLRELKASQQKIEEQNRELQVLASCDPLSSCLNRRAFFECINRVWQGSSAESLHIIMADIDHFKSINDQFGHGIGDDVIRFFGNFLRRTIGEQGKVCRYGGEEFCIALVDCDFENAHEIAESLCREVRRYPVKDCPFTASFGLSSRSFGATSVDQLLEQADQCLYQAKRAGRNRVVRWDRRPELDQAYQPVAAVRRDSRSTGRSAPIDYHAVHALMVALATRDNLIAEHAVRVAHLCVAVGSNLMPRDSLYALEVAALLHDIGVLGTPDGVLHKPGQLNMDEWKTMSQHNDLSQSIVRATLASQTIVDLVLQHQVDQFQPLSKGKQRDNKNETLGSRIMAVCDAYDCMVAGRIYRAPVSSEQAIAELRRFAPRQFDPVIVERLAAVVRTRPLVVHPSGSSHLSDAMLWTLGHAIEQITFALADEDALSMQQTIEALLENVKAEGLPAWLPSLQQIRDCLAEHPDHVNLVTDAIDQLLDRCRSTRFDLITRFRTPTIASDHHDSPSPAHPPARVSSPTLVLDHLTVLPPPSKTS